MPGTVIGKSMNFGWAGKVSRDADCIIEQRITGANEAISFGAPVFLNTDNSVRNFNAVSDATMAKFMGVALAEVKQSTTYTSGVTGYEAKAPVDVITRGVVVVALASPSETPGAGGAVYITPAGLFSSVATSNIAVTNAVFTTGKVDANGMVEITLKTKNLI